MDYLFYGIIGLGVLLILWNLKNRKRKAQQLFNEVEDVCIRMIAGNELIQFDKNDQIRYYGSILYQDGELNELEDLYPFENKLLIAYFKDKPYQTSENNLLIFKIEKKGIGRSFLVIIEDPVDMEKDYQLFKVIDITKANSTSNKR